MYMSQTNRLTIRNNSISTKSRLKSFYVWFEKVPSALSLHKSFLLKVKKQHFLTVQDLIQEYYGKPTQNTSL